MHFGRHLQSDNLILKLIIIWHKSMGSGQWAVANWQLAIGNNVAVKFIKQQSPNDRMTQ
jgi:hypothetical protein